MKLTHPTLRDTVAEIPEDRVDSFVAAGWLRPSKPKKPNTPNPQPVTGEANRKEDN